MSNNFVLSVVQAAINSVQDQLGEGRSSFLLEDGTIVEITPPVVKTEEEEDPEYWESSDEWYDSGC